MADKVKWRVNGKIDLVLSDGELEDKPETKGNNDGGGNDPMMQDTVK